MLQMTDQQVDEFHAMTPEEQDRFRTNWERQSRYDAEGRKLARDLADMMNGAPDAAVNGFIEELTQRTHRTLQQSVFGLFLKVCFHYADVIAKRDWFDLRNEYTVQTSQKIKELVGGVRPPHI